MKRPEGYPDLLKFTYLGCPILLDYKEMFIAPLVSPTVDPQAVMNYLVAEGFLIPEPEENQATEQPEDHSEDQPEDLSRN